MAHTESKYFDFPKMDRYGKMLLLFFGHVLNFELAFGFCLVLFIF